MAYNAEKIYKEALDIIEKEPNCWFVLDLVGLLGISKDTYYRLFPIGSDQSDTLEVLLRKNRVSVKLKMRSAGILSDNGSVFTKLYSSLMERDERDVVYDTKPSINENNEVVVKFNVVGNGLSIEDNKEKDDYE